MDFNGGWYMPDFNGDKAGGTMAATLWNIGMLGLFLAHVFIRDVSEPIHYIDFTKGFFWGFYLLYVWTNYRGYLHMAADVMRAHFLNIQMAPFISLRKQSALSQHTECD